jgi:hypothetical protein
LCESEELPAFDLLVDEGGVGVFGCGGVLDAGGERGEEQAAAGGAQRVAQGHLILQQSGDSPGGGGGARAGVRA